MLKKYFPYVLLLIAAAAYLFIKSHQRGPAVQKRYDRMSIDTVVDRPPIVAGEQDFDRSVSHILYSKHAHCRMACRHIDEKEVKEILSNGRINRSKIETDRRGTTYPVEGVADGHHLRIVFAPKGDDTVEVVTCIDLDRDWPCDCK